MAGIFGAALTTPKPTELDVVTGVDGNGKYSVVDPTTNYRGKSYSDWTTDWFNWFLSREADSRNSGPVVFLRSHGLPNRITGANMLQVPQELTGTGPVQDSSSANTDEYQTSYANDPNIRIGSDRLQIFSDQAVFVPIIVAYELWTPAQPFKDWGWMQDFTGLTIDYGDNPPAKNQLTINKKEVDLGQRDTMNLSMKDFRISTPIFPVVVPDAPYGTSIKDFLEDSPIAPGSYPALVEGYFVMFVFTAGSYWVHSFASAPRERARPYFSEFLYQVEVVDRPSKEDHKGLFQGLPTESRRPSRNQRVFGTTLYEKTKIGDLSEGEISRFKQYLTVTDLADQVLANLKTARPAAATATTTAATTTAAVSTEKK